MVSHILCRKNTLKVVSFDFVTGRVINFVTPCFS